MRSFSDEKKFYVYAHVRNDNGRIFYVGKGYGERAWVTRRRNRHWTNIASKVGYKVQILKDGMPEKDALEFEIKTIAEIGMQNLCNMTIGGDGASGYKMTPEQRSHLKKILTGRIVAPETRMKISMSNSGKKKDRKVVEAHANAIRGRKHSFEHVEKIRSSLLGRKVSEETRTKISASNTGQTRSKKSRALMSSSHIGKKRTQDSKDKQSRTMRARASELKQEMYGEMMKPVKCSNGMEFKSLAEAIKWVKSWKPDTSPKSALSKCALGKAKTAYGLAWSYINS